MFHTTWNSNALCKLLLKLVYRFRLRKFLKIINTFSLFRCIISHWRMWPFIQTNLHPLCPRMLYAKFGLNWPSDVVYFFRELNMYFHSRNLLHFREGLAFLQSVGWWVILPCSQTVYVFWCATHTLQGIQQKQWE